MSLLSLVFRLLLFGSACESACSASEQVDFHTLPPPLTLPLFSVSTSPSHTHSLSFSLSFPFSLFIIFFFFFFSTHLLNAATGAPPLALNTPLRELCICVRLSVCSSPLPSALCLRANPHHNNGNAIRQTSCSLSFTLNTIWTPIQKSSPFCLLSYMFS